MDLPDSPELKKQSKNVNRASAKSTSEVISDILKLNPTAAADTRQLELEDALDDARGIVVEDQDSIGSMRLPAGWEENLSSPSRRIGTSRLRLFSAPDQVTHLYYWDAAIPMKKDAYQSFCTTTTNGVHLLKSEEIPKLSQTLKQLFALCAYLHEDLILLSAKTEELNGKRVLVLQCKAKDSTDEILAMYWDASDSTEDRRIQSIAYRSPHAGYWQNLSAAKMCFDSITWR